MEPNLHTGDLVIAHAEVSYSVGEVAVFHIPTGQPGAGLLIVHRLVGGNGESGFTTQGDNKPAPDPWHPKASDVVGRSWIQLPGSGAWLLVLRRPVVLAAIIGGLVGFWFLTTDFGVSGRSRGSVRALLPRWRRRMPGPVPDETTK
jgi:signal peptidase